MAEPIDNLEPGKEGQQEKELKPGFYIKSEEPVHKTKAVGYLDDLIKLHQRTGTAFEFDGDKDTITPNRMVIVPKKKK